MPLPAGTKLGPYEILAPIGAGGMGEVYKANDTRLDRVVAIKTSKEQFTERFEREGRTVAALNHPNIAQLFDIGALPSGAGYLVMEYVEGSEPKGPLPVDEVLKLTEQIANALDAAHEKGITHRDLKPANIKIKPDGTVKVLDFGLAKLGQSAATTGSGNPETSPTLTMHATEVGMILGTAGYMSPEQARGKHVDRRADIWAFGVVLYELLTGKKLFTGEDVVDILAAIVKSEPDISAAPAQFHKLLHACLQKDPKQRLQAAGDWKLLLGDEEGGAASVSGAGFQPAADPQSASSRLGKLWLGVAAVTTFAALALGVIAYRHVIEEPPHVVKMSLLPPEKATVNNASLPVLSPDGRRLAFAAITDGKDELWVRDLDSLNARTLTGTDGAFDPFWSPDGRTIAFFADNKLKKIAVSGGPALTLCEAIRPRGGSWGKDDVLVFASSNSGVGLLRVSAAGGGATPVTGLDRAPEAATYRFPWFLPDGRHFLYSLVARSSEKSGVYVGDIDSTSGVGNGRPFLAANSMAVYAPPGYLLFVRERTLMVQSFDSTKMLTTGDATPLAEQIDPGTGVTAQYQFSVSQNGVLAYAAGTARSRGALLKWLDRSGKEVRSVGQLTMDYGFRLSTDENRIAFSSTDAQSGNQDVWVMDLNRGVTSRLTFDPSLDNSPLWSPDGLRIVYANHRSGAYDLYAKAATGAGQEELFAKLGTQNAFGTSWSQDGRYVMYATRIGGSKTGYDLWVAPQFGDRKPFPYLQTQFNEDYGAFSPNGRWVAYMSDESGRNEIYVQAFPFSGAKFQISAGGGAEPNWRNDGTELFYRSSDGKLMVVQVKAGAAFESGVPKSLFPVVEVGGFVEAGFERSYAVSSDGQRFLVAASAGGDKSAPMTVVLNWQAGLKK